MKIKMYLILFISLFFLSACANKPKNEHKIEDFSFINQEGIHFGTTDLAGSIWIADFIFTNCTSICSPMTSEMAVLQQALKEENIAVEFVSFTVDPTVDSPKALQTYADEFTNDMTNWNFLTGYTTEQIESFALDQFQTIVQKPSNSTQVIHSSNFFLIDKDGYLINDYHYIDSDYIEQIIADIRAL